MTRLVVNGNRVPCAPSQLRREGRAALHNLAHGKELRWGQTRGTLAGRIAYIGMTDPALSKQLRLQLAAIS